MKNIIIKFVINYLGVIYYSTAFFVVALLAAGAWTVDVRVGEDVTLECRFNPTLMDKRHTFYWIRANIKEKDNVAIGESPLEKNYR
jgi:hypothetical protein